MKNGVWTFITALVVAVILSGSAIYISMQYNQTQKDVANINAKAQKDSAQSIGRVFVRHLLSNLRPVTLLVNKLIFL